MKTKLILSTAAALLAGVSAASAADLAVRPLKAPAPMAAAVYSWTGFYIGGQVGAVATTADLNGVMDIDALDGGPFPWSAKNSWTQTFAGGHLGYDYQINNFVVGLEGDINARFGGGDVSFTRGLSENFISSDFATGWRAKSDWDASIRASLGLLVTPRALLYVTGGAAFSSFDLVAPAVRGPADAAWGTTANAYSGDRWGWTLGGGAQYAFDPNWSARIEYRHTDYGSETVTKAEERTWFYRTRASRTTSDITDDRVSVGVSYKFGGPAVANY